METYAPISNRLVPHLRFRTAPQSNNLRVSTSLKNSQTRNFRERRLTLRLLTALLRSLSTLVSE